MTSQCHFQGWFVIHGPGVAMNNLAISILHPLHRRQRRCNMWKMGWFGVVSSGYSKLLEIVPFDRMQQFPTSLP